MTQATVHHTRRTITRRDLIRALAIIAAVLITVVTLIAAFGTPGLVPSYDIVPDPAGAMGF